MENVVQDVISDSQWSGLKQGKEREEITFEYYGSVFGATRPSTSFLGVHAWSTEITIVLDYSLAVLGRIILTISNYKNETTCLKWDLLSAITRFSQTLINLLATTA